MGLFLFQQPLEFFQLFWRQPLFLHEVREHGLQEGVSTRLLIYAGTLMSTGVAPRLACQVAVVQALTDDKEVAQSLQEVVDAIFPA